MQSRLRPYEMYSITMVGLFLDYKKNGATVANSAFKFSLPWNGA